MAEENSGGKPADFFVGLVDFFAILLPGAILTFWLYKCIEWHESLKEFLPSPPENWIQFAPYAVLAYVFGQLLYAIGALCLDPLYGWWKESFDPTSLRDLRNKAQATDRARGTEPGLKMNQVYVRIWGAGATSEMDRLEADQKFFRGLIVVLLFAWPSFLWSWGKCSLGWLGLVLLLVPIGIGETCDRWKQRLDKESEKIKELTEEEKGRKSKEWELEDKRRKEFQLAWLSIVLMGAFLWLCYWASVPPWKLERPAAAAIKLHQEAPTELGKSPPAIDAGPTQAKATQTETPENKAKAPPTVDKRWVAGLLGLCLCLSAVRFGVQRVKFTEFVYRAYLTLHSQGPAAAVSGAGEQRTYINLPNRPTGLPFSDAVLIGNTLYISGRIGLDPTTGLAPSDVDAEMEFLFSGFQAVLRQAGMSMDDLVWVRVHCPEVSLWERFNATYVKFFSREFPARAFLGSGPLLKNGRFEMLGMAVKS